mmetsp:Transcript_28231/g.45422  ORF Transcript_28231/g.45422 Transcript_28231/m.45422 type:complete len:96 (+) Transcript_28231:3694-3981(+)
MPLSSSDLRPSKHLECWVMDTGTKLYITDRILLRCLKEIYFARTVNFSLLSSRGRGRQTVYCTPILKIATVQDLYLIIWIPVTQQVIKLTRKRVG